MIWYKSYMARNWVDGVRLYRHLSADLRLKQEWRKTTALRPEIRQESARLAGRLIGKERGIQNINRQNPHACIFPCRWEQPSPSRLPFQLRQRLAGEVGVEADQHTASRTGRTKSHPGLYPRFDTRPSIAALS